MLSKLSRTVSLKKHYQLVKDKLQLDVMYLIIRNSYFISVTNKNHHQKTKQLYHLAKYIISS